MGQAADKIGELRGDAVQAKIPKKTFLQFPVMSDGAEYLAMGFLKRRNIETYKAPPRQANFDLICIHPTGAHNRLVRVQVKSRYGTQGTSVPIRKSSLKNFDFLIVVALNVGNFGNGKDGSTGAKPPDFYVFPRRVVEHHFGKTGWGPQTGKFLFKTLKGVKRYKSEVGIELIAKKLGVVRPLRPRAK
jgi:hypothetical protein